MEADQTSTDAPDYAGYERFWRAVHQTCLGHLLRRCKGLLEVARAGAVVFPRRVKALLQEALSCRDLRDGGQITAQAVRQRADELQERMERLLGRTKSHAANERLARHLWKHLGQLFAFLRQEGIDATNWRAEQAIRPAVVNRKVWGGNRTWAGAAAQAVLMTVLFTARKRGQDAMAVLSQLLRHSLQSHPLLPAGSG